MAGSKLRRISLTLHNWMGLLVGIQIIFWFVGGLVMTMIPLDLVRGEVNMAAREKVSMSSDQVLAVLAKIGPLDVNNLALRSLAGRKVVHVSRETGKDKIFDSDTGMLLSPIDAKIAEEVALADFSYRAADALKTGVKVIASELLTEEPGDFRRTLPVWQVKLSDPDGTRIYVSPDTGQVLTRRNDYWRVFDFFWMLHIMDYDERENFNNPLLIATTITSTLFVFTGIILLYFRFWPRRKKT